MSRLVFDTSPLSHFARALQLPTLDELTRAHDRFVTQAVLDEIDRGSQAHPALHDVAALDWLGVVRVDGLDELAVFAAYAAVLGSEFLSWAEGEGLL